MLNFILLAGKDSTKYKFISNNIDFINDRKNYLINEIFIKNSLYIKGYSYNNEINDFINNKTDILCVIGKVFYRYKTGRKKLLNIKSYELLQIIKNDKNYYNKIKGNFALIWFDKNKKTLRLITDSFCIRPIYYYYQNNILILTNDLNSFKKIKFDYNEIVILEKILFTYPLSNETYFKDVLYIDGGCELVYDYEKLLIHKKFDLSNLFFKKKKEVFNFDKFSEIFDFSVLQKAKVSTPAIVSLTGGFDGRSILSVLLKNKIQFISYSFGKYGGENTEIPKNISKKLDFKYIPIYLEENYENQYSKYANEVIYFSDGLSFNERANYTYAFNLLSQYNSNVITGLLGGEILAPVHLKTDYINELYYDIFYKNRDIDILKYLKKNRIIDFINNEFFNRNIKLLLRKINKKKEDICENKKKENGFLYFQYDLFINGFKKYYGSEMHFERFYAENLTPFFDWDVINYTYSTNYINKFKRSFNNNQIFRLKNRLIQAKLICNNYPKLGKFPVDRGYPPYYLLNLSEFVKIPLLHFKRKRRLEKSPPEFDSPKWSEKFYNNLSREKIVETNIFNTINLNNTICSDKYNQEANRLISLYLWLFIL